MATYEHDYELLGIALPDELFGMFDTGVVLRNIRRYGIVILLLVAVMGAVWAVQYVQAGRERSERYAPVRKAEGVVAFLEAHHGTEEEVCAARQELVNAKNEARLGDGNDFDRVVARLCASNLELERRLQTSR